MWNKKTIHKRQFESVFLRYFWKFFLPMVVFSVVMNIIVFSGSLNHLTKENIELSHYENETDSDLSDSMFREIEYIASNIFIDNNVRSYLLDGVAGYMGDGGADYVANRLSAYYGNNQYIDSIYAYSSIDNCVITANERKRLNEFDDTDFLEEFKNQTTETKVWARKKSGRFPYLISMCKKMTAGNKTGGIIVNVDIRAFVSKFYRENSHEKVYILNEESGAVYYSSDITEMFNGYQDSKLLFDLMSSDDSVFVSNNTKYIKSQKKSEYYDWTYVSVKDFDVYNDKTSYLYFNMLIMNLVIFLISMAISFFAGKSTVRNIAQLSEIIDDTEKFNQQLKYSEVGSIAEKILRIVHSNKELREELEHRNLLITMEQIKNLQSQISPHFINNTLNFISLIFVSAVGKQHSGIKMIKLLSQYLNRCFDINNILITVEKEIENAKNYIEILKYKCDDMFTVEFNIDEQMLREKIIKFSLQPIIENSVMHGFAGEDNKNHNLVISAVKEGNKGVITITDNGVGMTEEKVKELMEYINSEDEETEHIGLKNVNKRFKLLYGEECGIVIGKGETGGTRVKLTIPLENEA